MERNRRAILLAAGVLLAGFADLRAQCLEEKTFLEQLAEFEQEAVEKAKTLSRDIRYIRDAVEYEALCRSVFRTGLERVRQAALHQTGYWAVVLDVDETVLDNSRFQAEIEQTGFTPEKWAAWVRRREGKAIPGAKEFLDEVRKIPRGRIVYITDRRTEHEEDTVANLRAAGLFAEGDIILTKAGKDDLKKARRECLESGEGRCARFGRRKIIALFGDSFRDFLEVYDKTEADSWRGDWRWGREWFVLPNTMYGQWERDYRLR